jgi:glycosyltransferase involved in cell wall biosynthesis
MRKQGVAVSSQRRNEIHADTASMSEDSAGAYLDNQNTTPSRSQTILLDETISELLRQRGAAGLAKSQSILRSASGAAEENSLSFSAGTFSSWDSTAELRQTIRDSGEAPRLWRVIAKLAWWTWRLQYRKRYKAHQKALSSTVTLNTKVRASRSPWSKYNGEKRLFVDRLSILLVSHESGAELFGGERSFIDLAKSLGDAGYNVNVVLRRADRAYLEALAPYVNALYITEYRWWRGSSTDEDAVNAFISIISDSASSVVHCNTIMLRDASIAARRAGAICVTHVRELVEHDPWICEYIGLSPEEIVSDIAERSDYIIANSAATALNYPNDKTGIIWNTVDADLFDVAASGNGPICRVGLVGSLIKKKGVEDFITIAQMLQDHPIEFVLAGPPSSYMKETWLDAGKLPRNVIYSGYWQQPKDLFRVLDVVVSLSHFAESFGRTILEAMAARRPVIAYGHGAITEIVCNGETGFIVDKGDVKSAAEAILRLSKSPHLRQRLGRAGHERANELFSPTHFNERLDRFYRQIELRKAAKPLSPISASEPNCSAPAGEKIDQVLRPRTNVAQLIDHSKPLKIAYFLWHFPVPSETFVLNELRFLKQSGHDVRVYCRHSPHPDFKPDFPIHWETVEDPSDLAKKLTATEREIVHAHFTYPTVTEMVWPACEKSSIPFTFIAHSQDIFRYENDKRNRIGDISRSLMCKRVCVPSAFHRDYLKKRGVLPEKIIVIPNGIDTRLYDGDVNPHRTTKRICAIHRFTAKKGLDGLIRAAQTFEKDGIHLSLYGYGPDEKLLRDLVLELNLTNVSFEGAVSGRQQLIDVLKTYDAFMCPSVRAPDGDMDGIPTVLMEAMATGVPVIATSTSGIGDLVKHRITGILSGDGPTEIAKAVNEFYAMPAVDVASMIESAREVVKKQYDVRTTVSNLVDIWRNAVIDVVIVSWNNLPELREVIDRLYRFTRLPFHLIICDNASQAETRNWLTKFHRTRDNVTIVFNARNTMVGPGFNEAARRGTGKYIVYLCAKEGFILSEGWDSDFARYMDQNPEVGMAGTLAYSPSYFMGKDYLNIPLFSDFRNKPFAIQNPRRRFNHVQGGLFVMRRAMFEAIGGFSRDVPHNYTDVEMSFYAESCGYALGEIPSVLSLYNKTRPDAWSRIDEHVKAFHPGTLADLDVLEECVASTSNRCNLCDTRRVRKLNVFKDGICTECGSSSLDRTLWRYLAASNLLNRRLPALMIGDPKGFSALWNKCFSGVIIRSFDVDEVEFFPQKSEIFSVICLRLQREKPLVPELKLAIDKTLSEEGLVLVQDARPHRLQSRDFLERTVKDLGLRIVDRYTFRSSIIPYDPTPLIVAERS